MCVGVERGVGVPLHGLKARRVGMACGQCFGLRQRQM